MKRKEEISNKAFDYSEKEENILEYDDRCFIIANNEGNIHTYEYHGSNNVILAFPTEEMRDAFYENFDDDIDTCKKFL